jgi:peroxiredoxin
MTIEIGTTAPDFALPDQHGRTVRLSDFRGKRNVVVVFFPFAFTGTCTGELCAIRDEIGDFSNGDVEVLAISCDSKHTQRVFAEQEGYEFPLLSDFWPHGEAAQAYGVFDEVAGRAARGTFLIDREGVVRWSVINDPGQARSNDDYRKALAQL